MKTRVVEGRLKHDNGSQTWYRRTVPERPRPGALPLIVLHGGPGMAHDYLRRVSELANHGREVIHYDQVGCGRSSHHPDAPLEHWSVDLFVHELRDLVDHWGVGSGFHLLGQSWGGMLAPEYVLRYPKGVVSLILMDSPASMADWASGTRRLLANMPTEVQEAINRHEAAQSFEDPEYVAAVNAFYERHLCRIRPWPQDLLDSFSQLETDPTVYAAMIGPSEFTITGTLSDWSVAERVHGVTVPTLVGYGEQDEATNSWEPFAQRMAGAVVHEFAGASHTPQLEAPEEFDRVVASFLNEHDHPSG